MPHNNSAHLVHTSLLNLAQIILMRKQHTNQLEWQQLNFKCFETWKVHHTPITTNTLERFALNLLCYHEHLGQTLRDSQLLKHFIDSLQI